MLDFNNLGALLGDKGLNLADLPSHIKQIEGFIDMGKNQLPTLVNYLNAKFEPTKGNNIATMVVITNNKIYLFVREFTIIDGKDTAIKTHWKGELFDLIEGLRKYLPVNNAQ